MSIGAWRSEAGKGRGPTQVVLSREFPQWATRS